MARLNKAFKKRFISALRSDKYEQGTGHLGSKDRGFCCLGVACVVAGLGFKPESGLPSSKNMKSLGLDYGQCTHLAGLNDDGMNFKQIASYISKHL